MRKEFNIAGSLDLEKLDKHLFENSWQYEPIILLSPETLGCMPTLDNFYECIGQSTRNKCTGLVGVYHGRKVFSDPTKKYGEVELR